MSTSVAQTEHAVSSPSEGPRCGPPVLAIVVPTYCEGENVRLLVEAVASVMAGTTWEILFVDDDSPDNTADTVAALSQDHPNVRCIRRIGRRGLSSAVVEGMLATSAHFIAVMDADLQHDERLLPEMLRELEAGSCDLVVGSRYVEGGSLGDWNRARRRMSALATNLSYLVIDRTLHDPMSGFFMVRRAVFLECVYNLSQTGYKILLDLIASSPRPLQVKEMGYAFRNRHAGESKVDNLVITEFMSLIINKMFFGLLPPRFFMFGITGGLGLVVHLTTLFVAVDVLRIDFITSQAVATFVAMSFNFHINNIFTYRDMKLKGRHYVVGFIVFCAICSVGAVANLGVASLAYNGSGYWASAGIFGAVMGAVFNFSMATTYVWQRRSPRVSAAPVTARIWRMAGWGRLARDRRLPEL